MFDPREIEELVGRVQRGRDTQQFLSPSLVGGHYYAPQLFIVEEKPPREAHTERAPSLATSATRMSPSFDAPDASSVYSSATDPPSLYGPEPVGRQRPVVPDPITSWLPCEFKDFSDCSAIFSLQEVNLWINHIIDEHLYGCLPKFSICWFCDGKSGEFRSASNQKEEKQTCFRRRMHHIAQHFYSGMTAEDIRPDFHFLDHLHDHYLIDEATFEWAKSQGELPNGHTLHGVRDRVRDMERPREVHVEHARSSRRRR